jgi:hypothetical protein
VTKRWPRGGQEVAKRWPGLINTAVLIHIDYSVLFLFSFCSLSVLFLFSFCSLSVVFLFSLQAHEEYLGKEGARREVQEVKINRASIIQCNRLTPLETLSNHSLFSLCFLSLFSLSVFSLCFLSLFSLSVISLCYLSLLSLSVFSLPVLSLSLLSLSPCSLSLFSLSLFSL